MSLYNVAALAAWVGLFAIPDAAGAVLQCPSRLTATPPAPFERIGDLPARTAGFETLSIVEGAPGAESVYAPAAQVPDVDRAGGRVILSWDVAPPRDLPMLMVCSYRGTTTYLRAVIPESITRCQLTTAPDLRTGLCN